MFEFKFQWCERGFGWILCPNSAFPPLNGHRRNLAGFTASLTADVKMFTYYDLVAISFSAAPLRLGLVCVGFPGEAGLGFGWVQCTPVREE